MAADVASPLHIGRERLIERLQEVADEAKQKRADAEAAQSAARQAELDAVSKLSPDQVANLLHHFAGYGGEDLVKAATEWAEEEKFVTQALKPTGVETAVERMIRVLTLANDQEIEVQPSDPLYSYL